MPYEVKIILDSVSPDGARLTTLTAKYPRFIHAEMLTHRVFSRNTSSSRAIPMAKLRQQVIDDPVIPIHWGRNQSGMQASEEIGQIERQAAYRDWIVASAQAIATHRKMEALGLHKQVANRVLEPFLWTTCLISSTTWGNFLTLRRDKDAQPEMQKIATMIGDALEASKPVERTLHLPYGVRDIDRSRHWSALEHPATAQPGRHGNFTGWKSYRKEFPGESGEASSSC